MIEHRFVTAGGRRIMMRRAGSGPPVVLLHESPRSSAAFVPLIEALAHRCTAMALDTPGYGGSDPLTLHRPQIADYADALTEVVTGLGLERAVFFGRHTGAAIAAEFALRHPDRVAGLVLEGCPAFTAGEREELVASYLPPFRPAWDGSHVAWLWSRVRDQFSFFPWYRQGPGSRLAMDMPGPAALHRVAVDFLLTGDGYRVAYEAAFRYDGAAAAAALRTPAHFIAAESDVLFAHLDRLTALPASAHIHRVADADRAGRIVDLLTAAAVGETPPLPEENGAFRFVHVGGASLPVRQWGADGARPLLLLADLPGSARQLAPLATHLAKHRRVVAFDLPGHGLSTPVSAGSAAGDMDLMARAVETLGLGRVDIAGIGLGASAAARLAARLGTGLGGLVLVDPPPDLPSCLPGFDIDLTPRPDGTHLHAAWHLARECLLYRPWFAATSAARLPIETGLDVHDLHERFVDMVVAGPAFVETGRALCDRPWPALLQGLEGRTAMVTGQDMSDAASQAALAGENAVRTVPAVPGVRGRAAAICAALESR